MSLDTPTGMDQIDGCSRVSLGLAASCQDEIKSWQVFFSLSFQLAHHYASSEPVEHNRA